MTAEPQAATRAGLGAARTKQPERLSLRLVAITYAAEGTLLFEFRAPDGSPLAPFTAGAHLDIHLPGGIVRQYSLVNREGERDRYVVAVKRDRKSRGGSVFMHEQLRVGAVYPIAGPRNNFPLVEGALHVVLIAGGIGVTPIWCMVQRLVELGASFELHYACRNRAETAFAAELAALGDRVHFHFDEECGGAVLDVAAIVAQAPADAHLYCCGPTPMLDAFEAATRTRPRERVHVEYFTAKEAPATQGGFVVELARSGRSFEIPPGKTILQVLMEAGVDVVYSCEQGICTTCETRVISGIPDHRDMVLTEDERAAGEVMMICVSGALSDKLVLDL